MICKLVGISEYVKNNTPMHIYHLVECDLEHLPKNTVGKRVKSVFETPYFNLNECFINSYVNIHYKDYFKGWVYSYEVVENYNEIEGLPFDEEGEK